MDAINSITNHSGAMYVPTPTHQHKQTHIQAMPYTFIPSRVELDAHASGGNAEQVHPLKTICQLAAACPAAAHFGSAQATVLLHLKPAAVIH